MSIVDTFLSLHTNHTQSAQLKDSIRVLSNAGQVIHISSIDELLASDSLDSVSAYTIAITEILKDVNEKVLNEFHITLNPELFVGLHFTTSVIDALIQLPATDQKQEILTILHDEDLDEHDKLYRLCSLVTDLEQHEVYLYIVSMGNKLWDRLYEVFNTADPAEVTPPADDNIRSRVKEAIALSESHFDVDEEGELDSEVITYIETAKLGCDLNSALNLLYPYVSKLSIYEQVASIWVIISGSSTSDVSKALDLVLEKILDSNDIIKVSAQITQYKNSVR